MYTFVYSSGQGHKHIQFGDHVLILAQTQACIVFQYERDMKGLGINIKGELQIYLFYYELHQGHEANLPLIIRPLLGSTNVPKFQKLKN
jgi:hypothetical protein